MIPAIGVGREDHEDREGRSQTRLTKRAGGPRIAIVLPNSGPVAQLGARFHGMEEVTGSIPVRSTKHSNNLDNANALGQSVCVIVCVITPDFAAF